MEREYPQEGGRFFRPGDRRAVGEIFSLIAAEKANFPVSVMCRALGVNRTSFHDWQRRAPSDRERTDAWLTEKIKQIHADRTAPMARGGSTPSCGLSTGSASGESARSG